MTPADLSARGWDQLDVILVTGDAYVDHPSFGAAIIVRVLEAEGYRVGVIAQPDWRSVDDFRRLGRPRLFFGVTAGAMDSMVNHYTAHLKLRRDDAYSPGGKHGLRPNRATIVYANRCREAFKDVPIVLGGVEASLRRLAHYDYWSGSVRRSILLDAKADILVYGMGERPIVEVARRLAAGETADRLKDIRSTVVAMKPAELPAERIEIPSYEEVAADKLEFAQACKAHLLVANRVEATPLVQRHGDCCVVENAPSPMLTTEELDRIYALPFTRRAHPFYDSLGEIPALRPVKFSITTHRGCFGGCSFCALGLHQGRIIQSRSIASILAEIESFKKLPDFKGIIFDLGGPTANTYGMACRHGQAKACRRPSCLFPSLCKNLDASHAPSIELLRRVRATPGVRKAFVASGVRHDLALLDKTFLRELITHHVGGHLKIAPEHICPHVLKLMQKPGVESFEEFLREFAALSKEAGLEQYVVPYLVSSHPGCTLKDMAALRDYLKRRRWRVQQVQDFLPTPMTLSTAMYHAGLNPLTGEPVYVARTAAEKLKQRALLAPLGKKITPRTPSPAD